MHTGTPPVCRAWTRSVGGRSSSARFRDAGAPCDVGGHAGWYVGSTVALFAEVCVMLALLVSWMIDGGSEAGSARGAGSAPMAFACFIVALTVSILVRRMLGSHCGGRRAASHGIHDGLCGRDCRTEQGRRSDSLDGRRFGVTCAVRIMLNE